MPGEVITSLVAEEALGLAVGAAAIVVPHVIVAGAVTLVLPALTHRMSGGAQQYGGRWSDLVGEAQLDREAQRADSLTLAGILASMANAPIISSTPGRARLRMVHLKGRADRSLFVNDAVALIPGVLEVSANHHTGTVLIRYDTMRYASLDSLLDWIVAS